ncbi:MAG: hypothetical protein LBR21_01375 [Propionibacteriaceae bacterium]|nr:hypothetical protein [Propionibacteriaceae bacterium]
MGEAPGHQRKLADKAEVAASYSSLGVTAAGADFWDTDFGDGTPREKLLDAALAENVRDKEIQLAAAERYIAERVANANVEVFSGASSCVIG